MTDKRAKTELLELYASILGKEDEVHLFLQKYHQGIEKFFKQHELREFIERIELSYGVILEDDYFIVAVDNDYGLEIGATIGYSDIWELEKQLNLFRYYVKESYEKYC
jgi:hypothetical protein